RPSSSPCSRSTTSATDSETRSTRGKCSHDDERGPVLHARHAAGLDDPSSSGLAARGHARCARSHRARQPRAQCLLHGRRRASAAARKATRATTGRRPVGPLHGVPVSIKDLTPTKGIRTTWGSKIFEDHVPDADAVVVERLKAAGAIVIGKTNTPEFGAGANTFNAVFGVTRNPWNPALTCGGSTGGGAVALATGLAPIAQGTDLGGSLRIPAAFCGVVGLRPSPGLVPAYPVPVVWDSYSVSGPMA